MIDPVQRSRLLRLILQDEIWLATLSMRHSLAGDWFEFYSLLLLMIVRNDSGPVVHGEITRGSSLSCSDECLGKAPTSQGA